jgi:hypothetical protein
LDLPPLKAAPVSPLIEQAESLEYRDKNYDAAIAIYRPLLDSNSAARVTVLHGLGRNLKNAGHTEEAIHTYQTLEKEPPMRIDSQPSDLVALSEIVELETGSMANSKIASYLVIYGLRCDCSCTI